MQWQWGKTLLPMIDDERRFPVVVAQVADFGEHFIQMVGQLLAVALIVLASAVEELAAVHG